MGGPALGNSPCPTPDSQGRPQEPEIPRLPTWKLPQDFGHVQDELNEFSGSHSKGQNVSLLLFFHLFCSLNQWC